MTDAAAHLRAYLAAARAEVQDEMLRHLPQDTAVTGQLYAHMRDYPLREAKGLRPALCLATCRAMGGTLDRALGSAAALELFHNAFLLHDDVEDGSEVRRGHPTLHQVHGAPVAMNVGDGMLAVAMKPLLENTARAGLGPALAVFQVIVQMSKETAEGQALELDWIRRNHVPTADRAYLRLVHKKTGWYSFVAPMWMGSLVVRGSTARQRVALYRFAALLGAAFQIQDDVLNLASTQDAMGKEVAGDLWEGKRTLILTHALRVAAPSDRARALGILAKPRPTGAPRGVDPDLLAQLVEAGDLTQRGAKALSDAAAADTAAAKTPEDIDFLSRLVQATGSIRYARRVALDHVHRAQRLLASLDPWMPASSHRRFLEALTDHVATRSR